VAEAGVEGAWDYDDASTLSEPYAAMYHGEYSTAGAGPENWTSSNDSAVSDTAASEMEHLMTDYADLILARHALHAKLPWESGAARRSRPMWLCDALSAVVSCSLPTLTRGST
jgi:hypothetical protein